MATPWGGGEETLTACNMDFFPFDTLDETIGLSSGETLEAIPSCLDSSIVSIFKDTATVEAKGLDDESEAMLLTALTEMLDNVDDENMSPFDTLPDSDLLSGHKGREHSPLRRLLCLSRSPPEKNALHSTKSQSIGTNLPRIKADILQRSDGEEEEEEGFPNLSLAKQLSSPDDNLLGSEDLTFPLPVTFEQDRENVSVSLGDLVRHMHSYCMTLYVDDEEQEQLLPEGGILLEVVDQGENGEPILAIPDIDLSASPPLIEVSSKTKQEDLHEVDDCASDSSEHIVVDDDDDDPASVAPVLCSDVKDNLTIKRKRKTRSCRKKKKKCKKASQPKPTADDTIRSMSVKNSVQELPIKPEKGPVKEVDKAPLPSVSSAEFPSDHKLNPCETETQVGSTTITLSPEMDVKVVTPVSSRPETVVLNGSSQYHSQPTMLNSQKLEELPQHSAPEPEKLTDLSAAPSVVRPAALAASGSTSSHAAPPKDATPQTLPLNEIPPAAPSLLEPKSKSLSLEEYRRLREQKKPGPVVKQQDYSSKWPSLPELPKELPPIPSLPDPSPKDFRRTHAQLSKKEVEEVKPAWQPRGPCAPPTPEALLVPPAYMVASSSKVSTSASVPKAQQKSEPQMDSSPKPSLDQNPLAVNKSGANLPTQQQACTTSAGALVPHSSVSQLSSKPAAQIVRRADETCSSLGDKGRVCEKPYFQLVDLSKSCSKTTTEGVHTPIAAAASPKAAAPQTGPEVAAPISLNNTGPYNGKLTTAGTRACTPTSPSIELQSVKAVPTVSEVKEKPTVAAKPQRPKSATQELIEAFTSEIGIKAADLTSLLEQFEKTQAKKEHCIPEVYGRAAAVGNSSVELAKEKTAVERLKANDLSSCADLTPPATPPHQMWKPLAPLALLGKTRAPVVSKQSPRKVIQIEARPLPSIRSRPIPTSSAASVSLHLACMDHDYCLPNKRSCSDEPNNQWNVQQQNLITNKPIKEPTATTTPSVPVSSASSVQSPAITVAVKTQEHLTEPLDHRTDGTKRSSVLETPDASPARQEANVLVKEKSPRRGPFGRSYRRHVASRTPSPEFASKENSRGRQRRRVSHHSPSPMSSDLESDSCSSQSSSRSRSPAKKRYRRSRCESSSSSSSRSSSLSSPSASRSPPRRRRYSYSSSCSGSWSQSRSWSRSPQRQAHWRSRRLYSPSYRPDYGCSAKKNAEEIKRRKEKAIAERRVVYIGRIRSTMTQRELEERFSLFGDVEDCTLHFRDNGDNYGFVTYYNSQDAFTAIDNGSKLRKPDELPFDLCFGGRRQFCQTSYSDLDSNRDSDPMPSGGKFDALDFDTLLTQAQKNLRR